MEPFRVLDAIAVPIDEVNVDTNQLCPTRFNKVPRGPGYERIFFTIVDLMRRVTNCPISFSIAVRTALRASSWRNGISDADPRAKAPYMRCTPSASVH